MNDLNLYTVDQIVDELKSRNMSFLFCYCDHNEFNKSGDNGIVWGADYGGNLVIQESLLRLLTEWFDQVRTIRTTPTTGDT